VAECREFERRAPSERRLLRARGGVILAAGGYNYNLELFGRYRPIVRKAYPDLVRGGSMGCDGSGIELGVTVGGALSHMDRMFVTKGVSPPEPYIAGVLVNTDGKRFITEDAYVGNVGCAVAEQPKDGEAWLILDSPTFWEGLRQLLWPLRNAISWWGMPALLNIALGGTRRATTLAALARKLAIDADMLEKTMRGYNDAARRGADPEQGKLEAHLRPMDRPPYFALNLSLRNKWGFSGTMPYGGLTVDEDTGGVTRADGSVVEGLYAAGRTALGICSESNFSGLSIADAIFSGRRAARAAVQRALGNERIDSSAA
jgi:3-oxo-5alpha-steroid 4-dehydrogenase